MIGRNDGFKLGLAYGRLIPTPGTQNVCPLTPVLARYRSSDSKRRRKGTEAKANYIFQVFQSSRILKMTSYIIIKKAFIT